MELWNFYLSGILYGICERTKDCVCHRPLDVHTGLFKEWEELTEDETWYLELGKMNVRHILLKLPDYEAGISEVTKEKAARLHHSLRRDIREEKRRLLCTAKH